MLKALTARTATKINVPKAGDQHSNGNEAEASDGNIQPITITGDVEGVNAAKLEIEAIVRERASRTKVCIPIERSLHHFICGPNNAVIQEIMNGTGVRIHVPPSFGAPGAVEKEQLNKDGTVKNMNEFVVIGEKEAVDTAVEKINQIFEKVVRIKRNYILEPDYTDSCTSCKQAPA
jgi:hypothetical protein